MTFRYDKLHKIKYKTQEYRTGQIIKLYKNEIGATKWRI